MQAGAVGEQLSSVRFISLKRSIALLQGWCLHSNHLGPNRFNKIMFYLSPFSQVKHTFFFVIINQRFFLLLDSFRGNQRRVSRASLSVSLPSVN